MDDIIFMMAKEYCGGNPGALAFFVRVSSMTL